VDDTVMLGWFIAPQVISFVW